jgi:hypothetical protein
MASNKLFIFIEKEELAEIIRNQRQKYKYKFPIDDFEIMPFNWAKLIGCGDLPLLKLLKKKYNKDVPGPLIERKVF